MDGRTYVSKKRPIYGCRPHHGCAGLQAWQGILLGYSGRERECRPHVRSKVALKLSKAGLVVTKRGKTGASVLARSPRQITLLDIYRASVAPPAFAIHSYPVEKRCPVSCHLKECMSGLLSQAQNSFERSLAKMTLAHLVGQIREKTR